jgi:hypothetical protein
MVAQADLILRVTAVSDVLPVLPNSVRRLWNANVLFSVQEVVKGELGAVNEQLRSPDEVEKS